jgi:hypothetical protein
MSLEQMATGMNANSEKEILITMLIPRIGVRRVRTFRSASVSRLAKLFPNQLIQFVHDGEVLNFDMALGEYAITDGSLIVVVPTSEPSTDASQAWIRLTRADNHLAHLANLCANSSVREEYARLRDLSIRRMEWKPSKYRRVRDRQQAAGGLWHGQSEIGLTVIPGSPVFVSTAALPALW